MATFSYRIDIAEGKNGRSLSGSSDLNPTELVERLRSGEYVVLKDLCYRDNQNRMISWSTWDPRLSAVAYINPAAVVTIMPFVSDPRGAEQATQ